MVDLLAELGNNWRPMITVARSPCSGVGRRHWPTPKAFVSGRHCGDRTMLHAAAAAATHRPSRPATDRTGAASEAQPLLI